MAISVRQAFGPTAAVLITGATGYIGSLVLEQLLRLCPHVSRVFILVRPKRGRSPQERLRRLLDLGLFHMLWKHPHVLEKVEIVEGDLRQPRCGISAADMRRLHSVSVVIHAAASIAFTETVTESLASNYQATAELADVAAQLPSLSAFVHVSTAYVNGHQPQGALILERFYPADLDGQAIDAQQLARQLAGMPPSKAEAFAARLPFPNHYCLTKWLAEQLLASRHGPRLPVVIVRPAITGAVASSPYPGYVGNRTGATGAALAIATGIWMFSRHTPSSGFDLVPGDAVSSAILLAAAVALQSKTPGAEPAIYHVGTSTTAAPLTTGRFYQLVRSYFSAHPSRQRFYVGTLPKRVPIVQSPVTAAALTAYGELKIGLVALLLWLAGRGRHAAQLLAAWKAVKVLNSKQLQFDLRFDMAALRSLQSHILAEEAAEVRPIWDGSPAAWQRYMACYMAGASALCLRQLPQDAADNNKSSSTAEGESAGGTGGMQSPDSGHGAMSGSSNSPSALCLQQLPPDACDAFMSSPNGGKPTNGCSCGRRSSRGGDLAMNGSREHGSALCLPRLSPDPPDGRKTPAWGSMAVNGSGGHWESSGIGDTAVEGSSNRRTSCSGRVGISGDGGQASLGGGGTTVDDDSISNTGGPARRADRQHKAKHGNGSGGNSAAAAPGSSNPHTNGSDRAGTAWGHIVTASGSSTAGVLRSGAAAAGSSVPRSTGAANGGPAVSGGVSADGLFDHGGFRFIPPRQRHGRQSGCV